MADEEVIRTLQSINVRLMHLETLGEANQDVIDTVSMHRRVVEEDVDEEDEAETSRLEKQLSFLQKWGWVIGAVSVIFSAGIGWAVFMGANATDAEVQDEVHEAMVKHNGYVDPYTIDPVTHRPVGDHPDMREAIQKNSEAISELSKVTTTLVDSQGSLDLRSRYQFEYTKWEVKKAECSRQRNCTRRDLEKPGELEKLEAALINR